MIKLFEDIKEDKENKFISKYDIAIASANAIYPFEKLKGIAEPIFQKYNVNPIKVSWGSVAIKSKLCISDNPIYTHSIVLNAVSFSSGGFNEEDIIKHLEHQIQHLQEYIENKSFAHKDDHIEINDWFSGITRKYKYSCNCGFTVGSISRKEGNGIKFLRSPVCCGSKYTFSDMIA